MNANHKGTDGREVQDGHNKENVNTKKDLTGINENVSGDNRTDENRADRRHHEQHGNRKYKMHSNHSSADDQPTTNTGPGTI